MTPSDEPVNLAAGDWPDDDSLASPAGVVPTARPGVSPTVRWVAIAAATVGVAVLTRLVRWLRR